MNNLFLLDNDFETESKYHRKTAVVINSSYLEFTRCCSSVLRGMFFLIKYTEVLFKYP